jgi:predicted flap endonuclease-1-like 5' DNA nuclease
MMELMQENWLLFVAALLIGIAVAYWIFVATRRTSVDTDKTDALDEGAAPAARNQALIDAPPAAENRPATAPIVPPGLAGAGTAVAAVVKEQQAEAVATVADNTPDDLNRIKGVGPKLKSLLISLGVTRFSQIAAWSDDDIDRIDAQLDRFEGRIRRDNWTEQARLLAGGDMAGYEDKFGKL